MIINYRQAVPMVDTRPDENTLLLLHGEDISDSSRYGLSVWNIGGVVPSNERSKFGEKSLYFNGSSHLVIPDISFPSGTQDYTVDYWQYMTSSDVVYRASVVSISFVDLNGYGVILGYWSPDKNDMVLYLSSSTGLFDIANMVQIGPVTFDQWQHYAFVRSGQKYMVFNNGTKVVDITTSASVDSFSGPLYVGRYNYQDNDLAKQIKGYIDELRVSNVARWTENFTPPTEPY